MNLWIWFYLIKGGALILRHWLGDPDRCQRDGIPADGLGIGGVHDHSHDEARG